ncbi:MAG TPA: DUF2231 domain-containing protein [Solirubrobacteraceae bacterium]|nr:DUF2231 domain-containing protein [Solirubrobacteraceae bacterium]
MTTETATSPPAAVQPRGWLSPQVLLGIGGLLTFVCVAIRFNTVYEGLPAHPLFVHVPVILIPSVGIGALIILAKPRWFEQHSAWLCAVAVISLAALNLTMNAGDALRNDLGLYGNSTVANLISRHAAAAGKLRVLMIFFTAVFIVAVALDRHRRGLPTGIGFIDAVVSAAHRALRGPGPIRILMGLLALGCLYFVFLTGDLGARAVWQGRVQAAQGFHGGGPPPP